VQCATAHSFAYGVVGRMFRHRLNGPRVPAAQTAKTLGITRPLTVTGGTILAPQQTARLVMETVQRFCRSADRAPSGYHVPRKPGLDTPECLAVLREALPPLAARAWDDLTSTDGQLRFDHDVYLKLWQLIGRSELVIYVFRPADQANCSFRSKSGQGSPGSLGEPAPVC
jgi:hypothetical protein